MTRLAWCLFLFSCLLEAQTNTLSYTYTIPYDSSNVTIGVKDSTGALVRTIVAGTRRHAGTYSSVWNGLTDAGIPATNGPFTVTVLYGNPVFSYWGPIGDTASSWSGNNRWWPFWIYPTWGKFSFMTASSGQTIAWITQAGSEGTNSLAWINESDPNTPHMVSQGFINQWIQLNDIANDGKYLYFSNNGIWSGAAAFVTKFDGLTGQPAFFTDPSTAMCSDAQFPATGCNGVLGIGGALGGPGGSPWNAYPGVNLVGIDYIKNVPKTGNVAKPPTSIAVQQTGVGTLLAVGHGNQVTTATWNAPVIALNNDIKFFNKDTGLPVGTDATVTNPMSMAFSSAGLWAIGDGTLVLVSNPSTAGQTYSQPLSSQLSYPMAVDTGHGPNNTDHIYVMDGGTSQQLKEFDASYNLVRTYGVPGGYTDCNPTIAHNRLMVDARAIYGTNGANPTFGNVLYVVAQVGVGLPMVRVENNGDVWIQDSLDGQRNNMGRVQHLTPFGNTFNYVNQIIKMGMNYTISVSHTVPNRVFVGLMEFNVDWTKTDVPGDPEITGSGAWQLVRDWYVGSSGACGTNNAWRMDVDHAPTIQFSDQLSNGRFYAIIPNTYPSNGAYVVELPASGQMRIIGTLPALLLNKGFGRDFSLHYWVTTGSGTSVTSTMNYIPAPTFDANGNPQWATTGQTLFSVSLDNTKQPSGKNNSWGGYWPMEGSAGGVYPTVDYVSWYTKAAPNGPTNYAWPHIAGGIAGHSNYLWTANIESCYTWAPMNGQWPCVTPGNSGTGVFTEGHFVLDHYCANGGPMPQFWLYYEDGMFIGQFGGWSAGTGSGAYGWTPAGFNNVQGMTGFKQTMVNPTTGWKGAQSALVGLVANCSKARTLTVNGGDINVVTGTESQNTPVVSWMAKNLSSIQEIQGTGSLGQRIPVIVNQKVDMTKSPTFGFRREKKKRWARPK